VASSLIHLSFENGRVGIALTKTQAKALRDHIDDKLRPPMMKPLTDIGRAALAVETARSSS
jgi:hypothetical protein